MPDKNRDLGAEALRKVEELFRIDKDRMKPLDDGFDWWPSNFKVSVRTARGNKEAEAGWKLRLETNFTKPTLAQPGSDRIYPMVEYSRFPTSAPVYFDEEKTTRIVSAAYIRDDNISWIPKFFVGMSMLQVINTEVELASLPPTVTPDLSGPSGPPDDHRDELLDLWRSFYGPAAAGPNQFFGSQEFATFATKFGRQDDCYSMGGGAASVSAEVPFLDTSSLVSLHADRPHPVFGEGLEATLRMPTPETIKSATSMCRLLNRMEFEDWTNFPLMGSWYPRKSEFDGSWEVVHTVFIPNALKMDLLITNLALWETGRARWVRDRFYGKEKHLTMSEVLARRGLNS